MNTTVDRPLLGASAIVFIAGAAATVYLCASMSGGMRMPGGWTMSMAWMRMPGQSWLAAGSTFMAMWMVMMIAMMTPSAVPMLSRTTSTGDRLLAGAAYFCVWAAFGVIAYPLGVFLALGEMKWRSFAQAVPLVAGAAIVLAGCFQLTAWKARWLRDCRDSVECGASAWRHGLRFGLRCAVCCSGLMIILFAAGVMDLRAMAIVTAAITAERFASKPAFVSRATGVLAIGAGAFQFFAARSSV
jgi:predicted metal-binding membrane protein